MKDDNEKQINVKRYQLQAKTVHCLLHKGFTECIVRNICKLTWHICHGKASESREWTCSKMNCHCTSSGWVRTLRANDSCHSRDCAAEPM